MILHIPLDKIVSNPWQTRLGDPDPEYLKSLALDIASNGLLQFPVGRLVDDGGALLVAPAAYKADTWPALDADHPTARVQLAFGHNRLKAYRWLVDDLKGWSNVEGDYSCMPVDLRPLPDELMANYAWSENEKRRDHTPLERAMAIEKRMADFHWTQEQIAEHLGVSRPAVSNSLRLLKLPADLRDDLHAGRLSERQALALVPLFADVDPESARAYDFAGNVEIVVSMARGGASSDMIRQQTANAIQWLEKKMQPALIEPPPAASPQPPAVISPPAASRPASLPQPAQPPASPARAPAPAPSRPTPVTAPPPVAEAPVPEPPARIPWEKSQIVATITWWPEDGHPDGRMVFLGLRANGQTPLMRSLRENAILLDGPLGEMLTDLKATFESEA